MANGKKTIWEIIKFVLVSCIVTVIQLVLVNALYFAMKDWTAPLPAFLAVIFNEDTMGAGHGTWGYILPFFLSNLIANIYGFFQNRKTTFHSSSSKWLVFAYIVIVLALIFISTWLQGLVANLLIGTGIEFFSGAAPTLAGMAAGTFQLIALYPIEKFVLFRKKAENKENE